MGRTARVALFSLVLAALLDALAAFFLAGELLALAVAASLVGVLLVTFVVASRGHVVAAAEPGSPAAGGAPLASADSLSPEDPAVSIPVPP